MILRESLPLPDDLLAEIRRRWTMEWWGGLGDVINHIHWLPCYASLHEGNPPAAVLVSSHNNHVIELLQHHPEAERLIVVNLGFHVDFPKPEWRAQHGLKPMACEHSLPGPRPVQYYPHPTDINIIDGLFMMNRRFVVFHESAGQSDRAVPDPLMDKMENMVLAAGLTPVFVGRDYIHRFADGAKIEKLRSETRPRHSASIDLTNMLTVPGVAALVASAAGTVTSHSSVCLMAWHQNRPNFLLYNDAIKRNYVPRGMVGYMFGAGRPENDHMEFSEFTFQRFGKWLDGILKGDSK